MKATGIVRKVDQLGRIVLPIELRRTMAIAEKDSLEIFTDGGGIWLRKYDVGANLKGTIDRLRSDVIDLYNEGNRVEVLEQISALEKAIGEDKA